MTISKRGFAAALAALVLGALLVLAPTVTADDGDKTTDPLARLGKILGGAKVKLARAVETAEAKGKGTAFASQLEVENGVPVFEVLVYVGGADAHVLEVEVNALTGEVMEVEKADDDDDDEDDDDEDEEGDEEGDDD